VLEVGLGDLGQEKYTPGRPGLYNTRSGDEATNQHGLISAPETPDGRGCGVRSTRKEVSRPALYVTHCADEYISARFIRFRLLSTYNSCAPAGLANRGLSNILHYNHMVIPYLLPMKFFEPIL
jgi:hypothetical protein